MTNTYSATGDSTNLRIPVLWSLASSTRWVPMTYRQLCNKYHNPNNEASILIFPGDIFPPPSRTIASNWKYHHVRQTFAYCSIVPSRKENPSYSFPLGSQYVQIPSSFRTWCCSQELMMCVSYIAASRWRISYTCTIWRGVRWLRPIFPCYYYWLLSERDHSPRCPRQYASRRRSLIRRARIESGSVRRCRYPKTNMLIRIKNIISNVYTQ